MPDPFDVAVLIGSLRANSYSAKVAAAFATAAPDTLRCRTVPIGDLPFYNQDHEGDAAPPAYAPFRAAIAAADGILFVTPEYNRSVPAVLKNAIDVASRPRESAAINRKPAAVISQSPGPLGGFGANHVLRQSLVPLGMPVLGQPELYLGRVGEAFDDAGTVTSDHVRDLLARFAAAFAELIARSRA